MLSRLISAATAAGFSELAADATATEQLARWSRCSARAPRIGRVVASAASTLGVPRARRDIERVRQDATLALALYYVGARGEVFAACRLLPGTPTPGPRAQTVAVSEQRTPLTPRDFLGMAQVSKAIPAKKTAAGEVTPPAAGCTLTRDRDIPRWVASPQSPTPFLPVGRV